MLFMCKHAGRFDHCRLGRAVRTYDKATMKVDEQLQARILTFVIREFLDNKATPRRELILAFETEDTSTALATLTS